MSPTSPPPVPCSSERRLLGVFTLLLLATAVACNGYGPLHDGPTCDGSADLRCSGSTWPTFALEDVNPASATFGLALDSETLSDRVSVVAVFAGW